MQQKYDNLHTGDFIQSQVQITEWVYFWDSGQNNGIYSIPLFYNFWPQILEKGKIA